MNTVEERLDGLKIGNIWKNLIIWDILKFYYLGKSGKYFNFFSMYL